MCYIIVTVVNTCSVECTDLKLEGLRLYNLSATRVLLRV